MKIRYLLITIIRLYFKYTWFLRRHNSYLDYKMWIIGMWVYEKALNGYKSPYTL